METQPKFSTAIFQKKFTLWHIRLNIYILRIEFSSHKQYLFGLAHTDQSILQTFLLHLRRNVSQTLKSSSWKKVFPKCVYHGYDLLRWIFFIPYDNWKIFFFIQILFLQIHILHNNITMLLITKVQNEASTSTKFISWKRFLLFIKSCTQMFYDVNKLFLIREDKSTNYLTPI